MAKLQKGDEVIALRWANHRNIKGKVQKVLEHSAIILVDTPLSTESITQTNRICVSFKWLRRIDSAKTVVKALTRAELIDLVRPLRNSGMKPTRIAKQLNVSVRQVYNVVDKLKREKMA